jgi:peptidoglycan hydrolase-like protein with peptidoglycan-binding domain
MRHGWLALILVLGAAAPTAAADPPAKHTATDDAIDSALRFLQRQQEDDGSWRAGIDGKSPAVTALAVMAFLSAGHVPGEGPYGDTVSKGVRWVLRAQQPNGLIAPPNRGGHEMYHHGICTLMLAEVVGMTDGKLADEVRRHLEKAVAVILRAQRTSGAERGGWRYQVAHVNGSDMSVTGWQVMALRAAKNVGCDVPPEVIDQAVAFIKRCWDPGSGGFLYMPRGGATVACTGTAILSLELCGKEQHHGTEALRGGAYLLRDPPRWGSPHFFYSVYYCSQATFQLGGNYWGYFRPHLHEALLRNQRASGCWVGGDSDSRVFGPNYCTAMAVLALTVEYRYLPIYQRGEEPAGPGK